MFPPIPRQSNAVTKKNWTNADLFQYPKGSAFYKPPDTPPVDIMDDGSDPTPDTDVPFDTAPPVLPGKTEEQITAETAAHPTPAPMGGFHIPQADTWMKGFVNSILSGEAGDVGRRSGNQFMKGYIGDIPKNILGTITGAADLAQNLYENPVDTVAGIPGYLGNIAKSMYDTTMQSGSHPEEFGRMAGNIGQMIVAPRAVPAAIRGAGLPTQVAGQVLRNAPIARSIPLVKGMPVARIPEELAGLGMQAVGEKMKTFGLPKQPAMGAPPPIPAQPPVAAQPTVVPPIPQQPVVPPPIPTPTPGTVSPAAAVAPPVAPPVPGAAPPVAPNVNPLAYFAAKRARYTEILDKAKTGALAPEELQEADLLRRQIDVLRKADPSQPALPNIPPPTPPPAPVSTAPPRVRTPKPKGQLNLPMERPTGQPPLPLEATPPVIPEGPVPVQPDLPFEQAHLPFEGTAPPQAPVAAAPAPPIAPVPEVPPPPAPPMTLEQVAEQTALKGKLQNAWDNPPAPMEVPTPVSKGRKINPKSMYGNQEIVSQSTPEPFSTKSTNNKPVVRTSKGTKIKPKSVEPSITAPTTVPEPVATKSTKVAKSKPVETEAPVKKTTTKITEPPSEPVVAKVAKPKPTPKPKVEAKAEPELNAKAKSAYEAQKAKDATTKSPAVSNPKPDTPKPTTKVAAPTATLSETLKKSLEQVAKTKSSVKAPKVEKPIPVPPKPTGKQPSVGLKTKTGPKGDWKKIVDDMKAEGDKLTDLSPEKMALKDRFTAEIDKVVKEKGHLTNADIKEIQARVMETPKPSITSPATKPRLIKTKKL